MQQQKLQYQSNRRPQHAHNAGTTVKKAANHAGKKTGILSIVQIVIMAALLAFIILMLLSGNAKEVDISLIEQKMKEDSSVTALTQKDMGDAAKTFEIDKTMIDEGLYWRMDDVMDVNELFIVKIADDNNRQTVISAVEKYLADKTDAFDGYGTDQFGLLSAAITTEKGDYYFFGVSEDAAQWEAEFLESIK